MVRSIDEFLDEPEHDARDHTGVTGVGGSSLLYGSGGLGALVVGTGTIVSLSGRNEYTDVTLEGTGQIECVVGRKLSLLCTGELDLQSTSRIFGDGRGLPGTDGSAGTDGSIFTGGGNEPNAVDAPPQLNLDVISFAHHPEGGAGGGGGSGQSGAASSNTSGDGGDGGSNTTRRGSTVSGGGGGVGVVSVNPGNPATAATAGIPLTASARAIVEDLLREGRYLALPGAGGAGGGGGTGSVNNFGTLSTGGAAGTKGVQTGSALGHGIAGATPASTTNAGGGGGGGGGGAGGAPIEIRVAGDLTIAAGASISSQGGDGGAGGDGGTATGGFDGAGGGGGGGGGGGTILVIYGGSGTNVDAGHIPINGGAAGAAGSGTSGQGGDGTAGLAGEDGHRAILNLV